MAEVGPSGVNRLQQRRWTFADCIFDEFNRALTVAGRRVAVEIKPLELLRALLLRAGNVVSKEELLDAVWPDVEVVEASLTTAVRKLRGALGEDRRKTPIIETVQRIGYRFAVPVTVEQLSAPPEANITPLVPPAIAQGAASEPIGAATSGPGARLVAFGVLAAAAAALFLLALKPAGNGQPPASAIQQGYSEAEVKNALRSLDVDAVERMIAAGWNASTLIGAERNDALNYVLEICQWNPGHDRQKMVLMVRTLTEAGARVDRRNVWGDTAYSIAKAPRNCGPKHPVTEMIRRMCSEGQKPLGDRCMASYELARGEHFRPQPHPMA